MTRYALYPARSRNRSMMSGGQTPKTAWQPRVEMVETERGYDIRVELPGVSRDDIKILIEQNILTISGEKKRNDAEGAHLHRAERIFGKFERSFRLPGNTDGEKVAASYDNGVLIIFLPRAQDLQNREIKIQSADGRNGDVAEIRTSVQ